MSDRKAVNKYYPPEWTPSKGSINKFRGTHALRERAKKLHLGILVIRFEMPYNIWCEGCENHIGMGVRYNAEKSKVGMYYTTPLWKFRFKCHLCDNYIEMKTDPANFDYVIVSGARRQERRWDPTENEQVVPEDKDVGKKLVTDPMFKLEHVVEDKDKIKSIKPTLNKLEGQTERWKDDYASNSLMRKIFRDKKKAINAEKTKDDALLKKANLNIELLPESEDDKRLGELYKLNPIQTSEEKQKMKRDAIKSRPLFWDVPKNADFQSPSQIAMKSLAVKALERKHNNLNKAMPSKSIVIVKRKSSASSSKAINDSEPKASSSLCEYSSSDSEGT